MNLPLVSVIIPFYKGKKWLIEALNSVYKQTYTNLEIILINDGSPEDISDVVQHKKEFKYVHQINLGAAAARNVGIKISNGDFIAFIDADDLWETTKIEIQIKKMLEEKALWSHSNYFKFNNKGISEIKEVSYYRGNVFPLSVISNPIATPTVIVSRKIFENNSNLKFAEDINYGEDTILWLLISIKYPLLSIETPLTKVRMRGGNSSMVVKHQIEGRASIWNWIKTEAPFDVEKEFPRYVRIAFKYCNLLNQTLNKKIESEFILKMFYFLPWLIFKVEKFRFFNFNIGRRK